MDFTFDEAQRDLAQLTRDITARTVDAGHHSRLDALPRRIDTGLVSALADADVLAASLPIEHGGSGLGILHDCAVAVELGRTLAAVPFTTSVATCGTLAIRYGASQTVRALGIDAARGRCVLAPAMSEELTEGNGRPAVTATPTAEGWAVSGTKVAVPWGAVANAFLVTMQIDGVDRVAVVLATAPGVTITPVVATGADCSAQLRLDEVTVLAEDLLDGADTAGLLQERALLTLCATQLGVLEKSLELVSAYATERTQFGRPIGSFQAVGQRLADAYIDVAAARSTLWRAAWTLESTGDDAPDRTELSIALSTAKFWAADAGHRVAHTMVHVHGGVGLDTSHIAHRYFLAAKHGEFTLGNATTSLLELGRMLVAGGAAV